jgi:DNA-binding transcriptional LysR family regulator
VKVERGSDDESSVGLYGQVVLDLRRLRVLRAVVRSGSVRAAGQSLGYTPSAISQHVSALERETGTVLLERAGRGVRPTDAARLLADVADDVLDRLADAEQALAALRDGRTGRLHLTSFPSAGAALVPPAVAALRRSHPHLDLVLGVAEPDEALPALRAGDVDVAVVVVPFAAGAGPVDDLHHVHLLDDPYSVLLPTDHPLAGSVDVDLADLATEAWVDTASAPGHCQAAALDACRAAGFTPSFAVQADEYPSTQGFVAAGLGVALVPALALGLVHERVLVKRVRGVQPVRHVHAAVRRARAAEPVVVAALAALTEAARELSQR